MSELDTKIEVQKKDPGAKFIIAILSLFISIMLINFIWTYHSEKNEIIEIATEKADIVVREYLAAIEFALQKTDNSKEYGKKVHRTFSNLGKAGKEFSEMLYLFADFKIKLIGNNPRNKNNEPDMYEKSAITKFEQNPDLKKVYKEFSINNKNHLRYLVPLRIKRSCLNCHGEPAGDIDATGYKKEGYKMGDLKGAISLTIPLYTEYRHRMHHLFELIIFYFILTMIAVIAAYFIMSNLVHLNEEIQRKNILLRKQHDTLKAYENEKAKLIEMIVHDLKNPLTTILGGLQIAINSDEIDNKKINSVLELSYSGGKRLSKMISDILDISAMEDKKFTPKCEKLDFKKSMEDLFKELNVTLSGKIKSLDLVLKSEFPFFKTDPSLLRRIIENIIFNSIKYSPPKQAEIRAIAEYFDINEEILIMISDKGEGIPEEHIDKVFDKFFQVGENKHTALNKGLGLTFCKFAVELMDGKIWVESEHGKGTTFYFTLRDGDEWCKSDDS